MNILNFIMMCGQHTESAAYRYWRLRITQGNGGGQIRISELDFSTTAPAYTRATDSTLSSPNITSGSPDAWPGNMLDQNLNTYCLWNYNPSTGLPVDITATFPTARSFLQMRIGIPALTSAAPIKFEVHGSNDNTNWKLIKDVPLTTNWSTSELKTFQLT